MTQPNPGSWQAKMDRNSPELFKEIMDVRNNVLTEGALPLKVKVLMTMLCDALLSPPGRGSRHCRPGAGCRRHRR